MKTRASLAVTLFLIVSASPLFGATCEGLAKLPFEHVTIIKAETVRSGSFTPPDSKEITRLPEFCRIVATVRPVKDSEIGVEVWLPVSTWNDRIQGTGNGGLAGLIQYGALAGGVKAGYAVANTDMGLAVPAHEDAGIFVNRPERWADWGYRSTHEMTVLTKELVAAFYGREAKHAYFIGCSSGGQQAIMESQRFPDDYEGIIGGAPANDRTGTHQSILWNFVQPQKTPESYLPPEKIELLTRRVLEACDALDGVRDGIIDDPRTCHFDPTVLACKQKDAPDCLTAPQVETVKALYAGPANPRTGVSIYPGLEPGSEPRWGRLAPKPGRSDTKVSYSPIFEWASKAGRSRNWRSFDFDRDVATMNQKLGPILNATSPDFDTFRSHGHKLLIYHGWSDTVVPPRDSILYYDAVVARVPAEEMSSSYRLFMVPGMEHCSSGAGPAVGGTALMAAVVDWVEKGVAPGSIVASKAIPVEGGPEKIMQRLLCPYPTVARYRGEGSENLASSYVCSK